MQQINNRRHHIKNQKRAQGFIPNANGQDNNNADNNATGNGPNGLSSSAAATTTTAAHSSSVVVSKPAATTTTTTTPAPAATTTTTTVAAVTTSSTIPTTSSIAAVTTSSSSLIVAQVTTSANQIPTTMSVAATRSIAIVTVGTVTSSATASASATADASSSSGTQIGPLIGAIGGGLVGVIALAAVAGYFFRRAFRKKDDFDRSDFVRNSVAINDDWNEKPSMGTQNALALARANAAHEEPSAAPRPPSMLERRGPAQPSYGVGEVMGDGYYGQQDQYYNYNNNGYYGHDQYAAGYDHQQYAGHEHGYPAQDQYAAQGAYGYTPPNEYQQSQLTRKPSAPLGAARGPDSEYQQQQQHAAGNQHDSRHQSVTPFQQQQYNDINKALNGGVTPTAENGRDLTTGYHPQQPAAAHVATPNPHGQPAGANNRRSVYEEEDAYGGI